MDVRSIVDVEPEVEHNGTVPVWYLIRPREMNDITRGGSLELVNEFEVAPGSAVYPHEHPTHEFYFVMSGRGVMTVADEDRPTASGPPVAARSTASASRLPPRTRARSTTRHIEVEP